MRRRSTGLILAALAIIAIVGVLSIAFSNPNEPLIQLSAERTPGQETSMIADGAASESLPGWIDSFEYSAAESLPDTAGVGMVFELEIDGNPSQRLQEFASLFGEEGSVELEQWSTEYFPSYKLETDDAYFSLYWHGSGIINYSSKRNWLSEECYRTEEELVEPGVEDEVRSECKPLPTVPIPDKQTLANEAFSTISAAGFEGSIEDISVERYEWGASAFASTYVDGEETAIEWYVAWDQTAQISNVSGHLATPVASGEFETISPAQAVSRISEGYWFGAAPRSFYNYSTQFDESIASGPALESADAEIMPVEPLPEPGEVEIIQVLISDATETTLLVQDSEGKGWLVPGYLLHTDLGWFEPVVSLNSDVIQPPG